MNCRFCDASLVERFVSLGASPLANSYLEVEDLKKAEPFYPLDVYVCEKCFLVQLQEFESPEEIFNDYSYFSSYSESWLKHARAYAEKMVASTGLNEDSLVVEVASNDGYLLQYFLERGVPVLGIEPAANVAEVAVKKGIQTEVTFFGKDTAARLSEEGKKADLIVGNNVLAHVPDINDFVAGLKTLLKDGGVVTMEFPHLMRLIDNVQFDTIYHEHFSYFSFTTVEEIFSAHGLTLFDVEELTTHGGSLRVYAKHVEDVAKDVSESVAELKKREEVAGYRDMERYRSFGEKVKAAKRGVLSFLISKMEEGKSVVGYGAPAKGNTLLNYCGIRSDFLDYTVDRSPYKQGRYLPGTRIPIYGPEKIKETRPDYIFILPWNLKDEIVEQMSYVKEWGCRFVVPIPCVEVI